MTAPHIRPAPSEREIQLGGDSVHRFHLTQVGPVILGLEAGELADVIAEAEGGTVPTQNIWKDWFRARRVQILVPEIRTEQAEPLGNLRVKGRGVERGGGGVPGMTNEDGFVQKFKTGALINDVCVEDLLMNGRQPLGNQAVMVIGAAELQPGQKFRAGKQLDVEGFAVVVGDAVLNRLFRAIGRGRKSETAGRARGAPVADFRDVVQAETSSGD